jgi:hypothetical protein
VLLISPAVDIISPGILTEMIQHMGNLKDIALGKACNITSGVMTRPLNTEERLSTIEKWLVELTTAFNAINSTRLKDKRTIDKCDKQIKTNDLNKDGIEVGSSFIGESQNTGIFILTVRADGYYVGETPYASLSAAAEAVSGIRRSGWTFWKLTDGRTLKEAFRR